MTRRIQRITVRELVARLRAAGVPPTQSARRQELATLARHCFVDRNAIGAPERQRLAIKSAMRTHLRAAIGSIRSSRAALAAGDVAAAALYRERALRYLDRAQAEFLRPFAHEVGRRDREFAAQSPKGGAETRSKYRKAPGLDDEILGYLIRGESTRGTVKEWTVNHRVSRQTVYNRIAEMKKKLSKSD